MRRSPHDHVRSVRAAEKQCEKIPLPYLLSTSRSENRFVQAGGFNSPPAPELFDSATNVNCTHGHDGYRECGGVEIGV